MAENWSLWGTSVNPGLLYPFSSLFDELHPFVISAKDFSQDDQGGSHTALNFISHWDAFSKHTLFLYIKDFQGKDVAVSRPFLLSIGPHILVQLPIFCVSVVD